MLNQAFVMALLALFSSCGKKVENVKELKAAHVFNGDSGTSASQSLLNALEANETLMVREALKSASVDTILSNGETPLTYAIKNNKLYVINELLGKKPNLNLLNTKGESAIHLALESQSRSRFALLLMHKPDLNTLDEEGNTPLLKAIELSDVTAAKELIVGGAQIKCLSEDEEPCTELRLAQEKQLYEISDLIKEIKSIMKHGITSKKAHSIIKNQNFTLLEYLLVNADLKSQASGMNLLGHAIALDNTDTRAKFVQLMLSSGLNPNGESKDNGYPLIKAVNKNDITTVGLLLQAGANPNIVNKEQKTPLMYAAEKLYLNVAKLLIEQYEAKPQIEVSSGNTSYTLNACFELPDVGYIFFRRLDLDARARRLELSYLMHCFQE